MLEGNTEDDVIYQTLIPLGCSPTLNRLIINDTEIPHEEHYTVRRTSPWDLRPACTSQNENAYNIIQQITRIARKPHCIVRPPYAPPHTETSIPHRLNWRSDLLRATSAFHSCLRNLASSFSRNMIHEPMGRTDTSLAGIRDTYLHISCVILTQRKKCD